jgi:DNA-binding NtrC family response regulator
VLLLEDVSVHPDFASATSVVKLGLGSVLCLPLLAREHLLGVLYVGKYSSRQPIAPAGLDALAVLAGQGAFLIQSALLLDELRLDRERLSVELEGLRFGALVGACPAMQEVFREIEWVATTDMPLLIMGERGVGKQLAAHEIHRRSAWAAEPFVTIRCSSMAEDRLALELFGDGSPGERSGKLAATDGTLFLGNIDELPHALQGRLLEWLMCSEAERASGVRSGVRVIASAMPGLFDAVLRGSFREDLYTRLTAPSLHLPPLRERGEDTFLIARYLLERITKGSGSPARWFSPDAVSAMKRYPWPGNVRELERRIRQASISTRSALIGPDELGFHAGDLAPLEPLHEARARFERAYIREVIRHCGGNRMQAARVLKIGRSSLYRILGEAKDYDGDD